MPNLEAHFANFCKKAARQITVLLRLSKVLNQETKFLMYNDGYDLSLLEVEDHVTEGTQLETEDAQKIRRAKTNRTLLENGVKDHNIM